MVKRLIYISILVFLSIPFIDTFVGGVVTVAPLKGDFHKAKNVGFEIDSFFAGSYQDNKSIYLNENLNIHPFMVRLQNQYLYSFFDKTKAYHTVIGKDGYLFDQTYISAYYGKDYSGEAKIQKNADAVNLFKEILDFYGKQLVVCFLPGKASFYPDKFPSHLESDTRKLTNVEAYTDAFRKRGVPVLNLKDYLLSAKDTAHYSLYPKHGIHISTYGTVLVADTLVKFVEQLTGRDIDNPLIDKIEVTNQLKYYDNDIYNSLNLLLPVKMDSLAYPSIRYKKGKQKCKALTIGDSFYKYIHDSGIHEHCFDNGQFWFYAKKVWPLSTQKEVLKLDVRREVMDNDVVIIFATEATLWGFAYGLVENILPKLTPLDDAWHAPRIATQIEQSPEWKQSIVEKAKKANISFEAQRDKDVKYLIKGKVEKMTEQEQLVYRTIQQIKATPDWYAFVKNEAVNKGENEHFWLYKNALYHLKSLQKEKK